MTEGAVNIIFKSNSLSNLSFIISIWSKPKKPHLKPNPNALDVSGIKVSDASLIANFSKASLSKSYSLVSTGNIPEYTIGLTSS